MAPSRALALLGLAVAILVAAWMIRGHPSTRASSPIVVVPAPCAPSDELTRSTIVLDALDVIPVMSAPEAATRQPARPAVATFTLERPLDVKTVDGKEVLAADRCAEVARLLASIRFDRVDVIQERLRLEEESILAILDRTGRFEDRRHGPYSFRTRKSSNGRSSSSSRVGTRTYTFTAVEFPEYADVVSAALARNRDKNVEAWGDTTQRVLARAEEALRGCPKPDEEAPGGR